MNLHIRSPQEHEWRICRMLLPETFADCASREYLLCLRDEAPRIVAAASYRREQDAVKSLRVHMVSSFRRQRVGSQLVAYIARSGAQCLEGTVDLTRETGVKSFCERNRFTRADSLTTVEGEIAGMREYLRGLRERIAFPEGARLLHLSAAPASEVANLHSQLVAHEGTLDTWRLLVANTPALAHSPVVMLDGHVAGALLWERQGGTAVVRSRFVAPGRHGGWVNTLLLAEGLEGAWASGARRVQFCYSDANNDTRKLAARFKATPVSVFAQFKREVVA